MLFEALGKIKLIAEAELPADPFYRCVGVAQLPLRGVDQLHQDILLYGHAGFLLEFAGEVASGYIAGLRQFIDPKLCGKVLIDSGDGTGNTIGMDRHIIPGKPVLFVQLQQKPVEKAADLKGICAAALLADPADMLKRSPGKVG